jgi:hypothetical protein
MHAALLHTESITTCCLKCVRACGFQLLYFVPECCVVVCLLMYFGTLLGKLVSVVCLPSLSWISTE